MWRKSNTMSGLVIAAVLAGLAAGARGQEDAAAPRLDPTHAQQALLLVETWMSHDGTPPPAGLAPIPVQGLTGVCVTLRTSGITVGQGQAMATDGGAADAPTDLAALLRAAGEEAFASLRQSLDDAQMRAVIERREIAAPVELSISNVAHRIQADVQLAGPLEPVRIAADAPDDLIYARFAPGYHGLRLTDPPTGRDAVMWPATAIAQNIAPTSQVVQLVAKLGRSPRDVRAAGRPGQLTLERFTVQHAAIPSSGGRPVHLIRGNVLLGPRTINERTLDMLADSLADHLAQRFTRDGELHGTYHPTSGRYDPLIAEPSEALLTAYALTRYVRQQRRLRPDDAELAALNHRTQDLAVRLASAMEDGRLEPSPADAALALLAVVDNAVPPRHTATRDRMIELLLSMQGPDGSFRSGPAADATPANQTVAALATAALTAGYEQTRRRELAQPARLALDHLWTSAQSEPNVNALPWLALAHERAAALPAKADDDDARRQVRAQRDRVMGELVGKLLRQQVVDPPRIGPADVIGGFDLRPGPADSPPQPNWTTAQLLMFLSTATRQPSVRAGEDELGWLLSAGLAARFLRQLQVQHDACYYVRSPAEAIGGIRLAPWNNELTLRAAAMTLLAASDLQQTLDEFK